MLSNATTNVVTLERGKSDVDNFITRLDAYRERRKLDGMDLRVSHSTEFHPDERLKLQSAVYGLQHMLDLAHLSQGETIVPPSDLFRFCFAKVFCTPEGKPIYRDGQKLEEMLMAQIEQLNRKLLQEGYSTQLYSQDGTEFHFENGNAVFAGGKKVSLIDGRAELRSHGAANQDFVIIDEHGPGLY